MPASIPQRAAGLTPVLPSLLWCRSCRQSAPPCSCSERQFSCCTPACHTRVESINQRRARSNYIKTAAAHGSLLTAAAASAAQRRCQSRPPRRRRLLPEPLLALLGGSRSPSHCCLDLSPRVIHQGPYHHKDPHLSAVALRVLGGSSCQAGELSLCRVVQRRQH